MDLEKLLEFLHEKREIEEERRQGPIIPPISGDDPSKWTPGQIFALMVNPIYAGVPPFPPIIDDDEAWIGMQCKLVERYGPELVFRLMLDSLRYTFEQEFPPETSK